MQNAHVDTSEKPYRLISEMRDEAYRPLVFTTADVLDKIERHAFKPAKHLRIRSSGPILLAGQSGALCVVEGETETERFGVAIPFTNGLSGIDSSGKEHFVKTRWFETLPIGLDGSVTANKGLRLIKVGFRLVELPFHWSEQRHKLSRLTCAFANETGLSKSALGRDLNTDFPDYSALAGIEVCELKPIVQYIQKNWPDLSEDPVPSRETIAATLAALNMRGRTRGRNSGRDSVSPQSRLRTKYI